MALSFLKRNIPKNELPAVEHEGNCSRARSITLEDFNHVQRNARRHISAKLLSRVGGVSKPYRFCVEARPAIIDQAITFDSQLLTLVVLSPMLV